MARLIFRYFTDCEDGKLGRFESEAASGMPVNILIDNADEVSVAPGTPVDVDVFGVSYDFEVYENEAAYEESDSSMAAMALIPTGTFSGFGASADGEQTADIRFSGVVTEVDTDDEAEEDEPNYCVSVESYGLDFKLYLRHEGELHPGNIIHGDAWLFGDLR